MSRKRKRSLWQRRGYPSPGKREHEAWSTPRRSSVACICTVSRIGLGKWGPTKGGQGLELGQKLLGVYTNMHPRLLSGGPAADRGGRSHVSESGSNLSTPPRLSARGPVEMCPGSRASGLRLPVSSAIKSVCDLRTYMRAGRLSRPTGRVDGALSFRAESALGGRSARELWVGTKVF